MVSIIDDLEKIDHCYEEKYDQIKVISKIKEEKLEEIEHCYEQRDDHLVISKVKEEKTFANKWVLSFHLSRIDPEIAKNFATFYYKPTKTCVLGTYHPISNLCKKLSKTHLKVKKLRPKFRLSNEIALKGGTFIGLFSSPDGIGLNIKKPSTRNGQRTIFGVTFFINPDCPMSPEDILPFLCNFAQTNIDQFQDTLILDEQALENFLQDPVCKHLFEKNSKILEQWKNFLLGFKKKQCLEICEVF